MFSSFGKGVTVYIPVTSSDVTSARILKWFVAEGDAVKSGTDLCEIETDQFTLDVTNDVDGTLVKILAHEGEDDLPVGASIAVIAENPDDIPAIEKAIAKKFPKE